MRSKLALALAALALPGATAAADVQIEMFVFENADSAPTAGLDIWIEAIDNATTLDLVWHNDSTINASITDIYLEGTDFANLALADATIVGGAGVSFHEGASPSSPAGSIQHFGGVWKGSLFSADPDTPHPMVNAINTGEALTVSFDMAPGYTAADAISALLAGADGFRIAAHVQGVDPNDASLWVVTPTPGTAALLGCGALLNARRRRH